MMKYRKWHVLMVLLLLLAALALPVQADTFTYVQDDALLISTAKAAQLDETAAAVSEQYGCGVYIATVLDYSPYGSSVREAAENYFLANEFGIGSDDNGVLLFLSMAERDYALIAHGNTGNTAFTDYGKDILSETFLDNFRYDDWAGGFADYLNMSEQLLHAAATGEPVDVAEKRGSGTGLTLVMVLLIPAAIAGISCACMAFSMKTARRKTHADDYRGDVQLNARHDRFITRTVVRQKIESSSSSGGTRVNSGGFSGKSGKF